MSLESDINNSNAYYLETNKAIIHKKPVPITIAKVEYITPPVIKEAYFKTPSTTDYNGLYKGKYIDFEAKETKYKSFPLNNIHKHQIKHLTDIVNHKGLSFIIVSFTTLNKVFLIKTIDLIDYYKTDKKSIPLEYFIEKAFIINEGFNPRLDYLKTLDIAFREELNE